ncbi:ABC-2 family transporter protein [Clostridium amazonitimonense]|uniref:ABC-2 family transporter protein n=1 Tax=Clostridium amazonitimonense TaxID=1499689 RepID=UPI00050991E9|nr:ABC-2 family transporter protein [Clostridium amazonitimonense]
MHKQTIIYVIISSAISNVIAVNKVPEFAQNIKNGKVLKYLIRPVNLFNQIILQEIGNCLIDLIQIIPIGIGAFCINLYFYNYVGNGLQLCVSLSLSIILSILMTNVFFSITFVTMNYSGAKALLQGVNALLSGSLVPLILWPQHLSMILKWSPFALIVDAPIQIFLGLQSFYTVLGLQIIWCIIFYLIGQVLFLKLPVHCEYAGG